MRRFAVVLLALSAAFATGASAAEPETLETIVEEELIGRPYLASGWVRVRVEGATVTLLGRVPDELLHALVRRSVRNVRGVKAVKDRLEVDPTLERWTPTSVERARLNLENARRALRADPAVGVFTTLHVSRARDGFTVTGTVSSGQERLLVRRLVEVAPGARIELRVGVAPDASRRAEAIPASDPPTAAFARSVTDAIASEPLLGGLVSVRAEVERGALVLRGSAATLAAHDLAVEIARGRLIARQREAAEAGARRGPLFARIAGEPEPFAGEVPANVESLLRIEKAS